MSFGKFTNAMTDACCPNWSLRQLHVPANRTHTTASRRNCCKCLRKETQYKHARETLYPTGKLNTRGTQDMLCVQNWKFGPNLQLVHNRSCTLCCFFQTGSNTCRAGGPAVLRIWPRGLQIQFKNCAVSGTRSRAQSTALVHSHQRACQQETHQLDDHKAKSKANGQHHTKTNRRRSPGSTSEQCGSSVQCWCSDYIWLLLASPENSFCWLRKWLTKECTIRP